MIRGLIIGAGTEAQLLIPVMNLHSHWGGVRGEEEEVDVLFVCVCNAK